MMRSGVSGDAKGSAQVFSRFTDYALRNQPGTVDTAPRYVIHTRKGCHVQHQQLGREVIDQGRQPLADVVAEIDSCERGRKGYAGARIDDDGAAAGVPDTTHDLLRTIETVARWGNDHDDTAAAPLERQEVFEVRPFLEVAADSVDRYLFMEPGRTVLRSPAARAGSDRPDRIDAVEFLREGSDARFDAGGDFGLCRDCTFDLGKLRGLRGRADLSALHPQGERKGIKRVEHRQVLGKVQEAAAVVSREGRDLAYRAMHHPIRLPRELSGKAAGDAERRGAAILGEKHGFPGARRASGIGNADHEVARSQQRSLIARELYRRLGLSRDTGPAPKGGRNADRPEETVSGAADQDAFRLSYAVVEHGGRDVLPHDTSESRKIERMVDRIIDVGGEGLAGFVRAHV